MTRMVVEINLETVISFSEKNDAVLLAATEDIKNNWLKFINEHQANFDVKVFCELEEGIVA